MIFLTLLKYYTAAPDLDRIIPARELGVPEVLLQTTYKLGLK